LGSDDAAASVSDVSASVRARQVPRRSDEHKIVRVDTGTHDLGTGTYTVMQQVAADTLGVPTKK
jgi:xanthine dehydrogenase YagR molybdenum-binding subunit